MVAVGTSLSVMGKKLGRVVLVALNQQRNERHTHPRPMSRSSSIGHIGSLDEHAESAKMEIVCSYSLPEAVTALCPLSDE
jgi:hypothetical protein